MFFTTALPLFVGLVDHWSAGTEKPLLADLWMSVISRVSDDLAEALPPPPGGNGQSSADFRGNV